VETLIPQKLPERRCERVSNKKTRTPGDASDTGRKEEKKKRERERERERERQYNQVIFSAPANARVGTRETFFASACFFSLLGRRIFSARRKQ